MHGEPEQEKRSFRDFAKSLCLEGRTWPQIRAVARATMWAGHIGEIETLVAKRGDAWREDGSLLAIEAERAARREKRVAQEKTARPKLRIVVPVAKKPEEKGKKKIFLKFSKKITKS